MPRRRDDLRIADTEEAVFDRVVMTVDLPVVSSVHRIGAGVWRAVYADGRTFATVYAGRHTRSGEFDVTYDLAEAERREAEALRQAEGRRGNTPPGEGRRGARGMSGS